jgi:hypothetical protein
LYIDFYSILLYVLAVYVNHQWDGIWFTKRVKGERPLLTNSGYKITAKIRIIIPKVE